VTADKDTQASHWTDGLSNLPDDARGYFACFALIQNAWNACLNGSWMLRLALELAPDESSRTVVREVATQVTGELAKKLEPHMSSRSGGEADPVKLAYEDAKTELQLTLGALDLPVLGGSVTEPDRPLYDRSLKEIRRLCADLVRARLPSPAPPARIVPDAFEDTRVGPSDIAEIARKVMEEAAAEDAAREGAPPETPSEPRH
jgi:hypothetical protein